MNKEYDNINIQEYEKYSLQYRTKTSHLEIQEQAGAELCQAQANLG